MTGASAAGDLARARSLLAIGRWAQARTLLSAVLARHPDSYEAACLLARTHQQALEWRPMLAAADAAVALGPNRDWGHRLRSVALQRLGRAAEAVAAAEAGVRCAPHAWLTHNDLASALLSVAPRPALLDAYRAARRAVNLGPLEPAPHVTLGRVYKAAGDRRGARRAEQAALAISPDHAIARNNRAADDLNSGRILRAAHQFGGILADRPQEPLFQNNLRAAAMAWLRRRSDIVLLAWLGTVALVAIKAPPPVVRGGAALLAAAGLGSLLMVRRLPRAARRFVLGQDPGNRTTHVVEVVRITVPLLAAVARTLPADTATPLLAPLRVPLAFCCVIAARLLAGRLVRAAARYWRRWLFRRAIARDDGRESGE